MTTADLAAHLADAAPRLVLLSCQHGWLRHPTAELGDLVHCAECGGVIVTDLRGPVRDLVLAGSGE